MSLKIVKRNFKWHRKWLFIIDVLHCPIYTPDWRNVLQEYFLLLRTQHNDPKDPSQGSQTASFGIHYTKPLDHCNFINNVENNYHQCNRTALPSLDAVQVHVLMHHTKPHRLQRNLFLVSNVLTCGIPFQTVGHELYLFLEALHQWSQDDAQAFSIFLQFYHPIFLIDHLLVCLVLLQREIILLVIQIKCCLLN